MINRILLNRMDHVTAVSDAIRERILKLGLDKDHVSVLPNAIDENHFNGLERIAARRTLGIPIDKPVMLYVGSLIPRKGVCDLIRAAPSVLASVPDLLIYIVGSGLRAIELHKLARELVIQDSVNFIGARPSDEISKWMAAADVFVLPSYSEGRPTVVIEAMAAGTPVLATDIDGTRELVEDGATGFLYAPGEPVDLAAKATEILRDESLLKEFSTRARDSVKERGFTCRQNAARLIRIYEEVLG
jgi:glycosyltransferase involved in cell wall biosynthesis